MGTKKGLKRGQSQPPSPSPATAPVMPPSSSTSAVATPFSPSSSHSKSVFLLKWWLIISDIETNGKKLAVGGFNARGRHATRVFTSAPIVKRYDAYTLETADGITVRIQGFIDESRTRQNGIPPKVSRCFSVGFPYNWDQFAHGDFGIIPTSPVIPTSSSGYDKKPDFPVNGKGSGFLSCILTTRHDSLIDNNLSRDVACTPQNPTVVDPLSTALLQDSDVGSFAAHASLPVENLGRSAANKIDQAPGINMGFTNRIGHATGEDATWHTVKAFSRLLHSNSGKGLSSYARRTGSGAQRIRVDRIHDTEVGKDSSINEANFVDPDMAFETVVKSSPSDEEKNVNNHASSSTGSAVESVSSDLLQTERNNPQDKLGRRREPYALRSRDHVQNTVENDIGVLDDSLIRKNSKGSDANSMAADTNVPSELSLNLNARILCKSPDKKGTRKDSQAVGNRLEVNNEHISLAVENTGTNALGTVQQCGLTQSPVTGGFQESTHVLSINESNSKHHYKLRSCSTSVCASPDAINKKEVDHFERNMALRRSSNEKYLEAPTSCSVKRASHIDSSAVTDSEKTIDITGDQIDKLSDDLDSEAPAEEHRKRKRSNTCRSRTVW